jgi:hypothetical protein
MIVSMKMTVFWDMRPCIWMPFTLLSWRWTQHITSEALVPVYQITHHIPDDGNLKVSVVFILQSIFILWFTHFCTTSGHISMYAANSMQSIGPISIKLYMVDIHQILSSHFIFFILRIILIYFYLNMLGFIQHFWGSHSHDHSGYGLPGCDVVYSCRCIPLFQRNMLSPSSGTKCVEWDISLVI